MKVLYTSGNRLGESDEISPNKDPKLFFDKCREEDIRWLVDYRELKKIDPKRHSIWVIYDLYSKAVFCVNKRLPIIINDTHFHPSNDRQKRVAVIIEFIDIIGNQFQNYKLVQDNEDGLILKID